MDNLKIAQELVRVAKSLTAAGPVEVNEATFKNLPNGSWRATVTLFDDDRSYQETYTGRTFMDVAKKVDRIK